MLKQLWVFNLTWVRMANISWTTGNRCWRDCGEKIPPFSVMLPVNLSRYSRNHCGESSQSSNYMTQLYICPQNLKFFTFAWPAILILYFISSEFLTMYFKILVKIQLQHFPSPSSYPCFTGIHSFLFFNHYYIYACWITYKYNLLRPLHVTCMYMFLE